MSEEENWWSGWVAVAEGHGLGEKSADGESADGESAWGKRFRSCCTPTFAAPSPTADDDSSLHLAGHRCSAVVYEVLWEVERGHRAETSWNGWRKLGKGGAVGKRGSLQTSSDD
jgi:hypothetical protein